MNPAGRKLIPAYNFKGKTFVWSCEACATLFFLGTEEARADGPAPQITREFMAHSCERRPAEDQDPSQLPPEYLELDRMVRSEIRRKDEELKGRE